MTGPLEPPITIGSVFDVDSAVNWLRAALHEPLPFVVSQERYARHYAVGLVEQPNLVTDDNREAIAKALLCVAAQLAAAAVLGEASGAAIVNMLGLVGLHVLDGDVP
jgi:hypothetical protein